MKKILSLALAVLMLVSALPVAYAAEGETSHENGTQITYIGSQEEAAGGSGAVWTVTVPAKMQPGQTGTVTAQGTWATDQFINVHAPETVTLTYGAQSMDVDISWANESCGFSKIGSNTETVTHSVDITVAEASRLFGEWTGLIEYTVALIENGDVNRDGMITEDDVTRIQQHMLTDPEKHVDLSTEGQLYADINGDGNLNILDVVFLRLAVDSKCSPNAVNAVQPVTIVSYSYNGAIVPYIDEVWTDKEAYPNAIITASEDRVTLMFGKISSFDGETITMQDASLYIYTDSQAVVEELAASYIYISAGEWSIPAGSVPSERTIPASAVTWTSHDILNGDGSVYLAASDPIPVS